MRRKYRERKFAPTPAGTFWEPPQPVSRTVPTGRTRTLEDYLDPAVPYHVGLVLVDGTVTPSPLRKAMNLVGGKEFYTCTHRVSPDYFGRKVATTATDVDVTCLCGECGVWLGLTHQFVCGCLEWLLVEGGLCQKCGLPLGGGSA